MQPIFAMRTFDDTGKEFLSNYIGSDYAGILPSLDARHAVIFGKPSSCENSVLVRLNERDAFLASFRNLHPVAPMAAAQVMQAADAPHDAHGDNNDEIPQ